MHTTNLRKVGGSVMLAVPPAILDLLRLEAGATVEIAVEAERLIIQPRTRPGYTLNQLLAQCKAKSASKKVARKKEERDWLDLAPVGREL